MRDETLWTHFEAQRTCFANPRLLGHASIVLQHGAWGGAVALGRDKSNKQMLVAMRAHIDNDADKTDAEDTL